MFDYKETRKNLKKSYRLVKNKKKVLIGFIITLIFLSVISAIIPLFTARALIYLTDGLWKNLIIAALIIFVVEINRNIWNYLNQYFSSLFFKDSGIEITFNVAKEILKLESKEIDQNTSGTFIERVGKDTSKISEVFIILSRDLSNILTNIGILIAIFIINKWFFLFFI